MQKIFFIVGFPRSGTSMLVQLLNEHPSISVQHESKFIPLFFNSFNKACNLNDFEKFADELSSFLSNKARYTGITRKDEILDAIHKTTQIAPIEKKYANICEKIIHHKDKLGAKVIGDKTPAYIFDMQTLKHIYPDAKFIHLVRDGRDSFLSIKNLSWGPDNVYFAAKEWCKYLDAWDKSAKKQDSYLEIRYEDLITTPSEVAISLCNFLGVDANPEYFAKFPVKRQNFSKCKNSFNMRKEKFHIFQELAKKQLTSRKYPFTVTEMKFWKLLIPIFIIDQIWRRFFNKILQSHWLN